MQMFIWITFTSQQQQAALMAAATAQGTYINPMAALATQIPHALNGKLSWLVVKSLLRQHFNRFILYIQCSFVFGFMIRK